MAPKIQRSQSRERLFQDFQTSVTRVVDPALQQLSEFIADAKAAWHYLGDPEEPPLMNGWVWAGLPYGRPRFVRRLSRVSLAIAVKNGALSTTVCILPEAYRPPEQILIPIVQFGGPTFATIGTDGSIASGGTSNTLVEIYASYWLE